MLSIIYILYKQSILNICDVYIKMIWKQKETDIQIIWNNWYVQIKQNKKIKNKKNIIKKNKNII